MCMALQIKKGISDRILYEAIPFIANKPNHDYTTPLKPFIELDFYCENTNSITLNVSASGTRKFYVNGELFSTSGVFSFTPKLGLNIVKILDDNSTSLIIGKDVSTSTVNTNHYSIVNTQNVSKGGTNATLIGVRCGGNVSCINHFAFANCTALKYAVFYPGFTGDYESGSTDSMFVGCTNLETVAFCGTGFSNTTLSTPKNVLCLEPNHSFENAERVIILNPLQSPLNTARYKSKKIFIEADNSLNIQNIGSSVETLYILYGNYKGEVANGDSILWIPVNGGSNLKDIYIFSDKNVSTNPNDVKPNMPNTTIHIPNRLCPTLSIISDWASAKEIVPY